MLIQQGQAPQALALLQEEVLPIVEQLGDVREKAVKMGYIADILARRCEVEAALRIRYEEELPVYEQLGDVHALLVTRANLAIGLWQQDAQINQAEIQRLLCLALHDARRMQIVEAQQIEEWLEYMELSCEE